MLMVAPRLCGGARAKKVATIPSVPVRTVRLRRIGEWAKLARISRVRFTAPRG
jgi:hypothetical protein